MCARSIERSQEAIPRHQTARFRTELSKPVRLVHEAGLIGTETSVFDYGCGRGDDMRGLKAHGIRCEGWDPAHLPRGKRTEADVVNLGYVVNVIEDPVERQEALQEAWSLSKKILVVAARLKSDAKSLRNPKQFGDGHLTKRGTFQKFYSQHELRDWIDSALGVAAVAAAPGIFFVFRDDGAREAYIASQYRRRAAMPRLRQSDVLYEKHKDLLQPLINFVTDRGRLPDISELLESRTIEAELGSIKRAFGIIRRVTGSDQWDQITEERSQDLLIYLALARFSGRQRLSELAIDMRRDVRAFFSNYTKACQAADELLFSAGDVAIVDKACKDSPCGKLTHEALYVHVTALPQLPAILRVYEGCARNYIGVVEDANLIKLHRRKPKVSYLAYPKFDRDPHPALAGALIVPLSTFEVKYYNYAESTNPPILHRKETFVADDYPGRDKFERLTRQEERRGLYEDTKTIGTRNGWTTLLESKGLKLQGHRLTRSKPAEKQC